MVEIYNKSNRRKVLKMGAASLATVMGTGAVSAQSNESDNPANSKGKGRGAGGDSEAPWKANTSFNPEREVQVKRFVLAFADIEEEKHQNDLWEELNYDQKMAVSEAFQPREYSMSLERVSNEKANTGFTTMSSNMSQTSYKNTITANGLGGVTAFVMEHEISWLYDTEGPWVEDCDHSSRITKLAWNAWSDEGVVHKDMDRTHGSTTDGDEGYVNFRSSIERRVDWINNIYGMTSYYPYSEIGGDSSGAGKTYDEYNSGVT